ncbi:MAG: DUF2937 family protein [Alphaproteobacteria bacterium]|nr:DUF2937 family protein [Alphaproteobacteria bacterium]
MRWIARKLDSLVGTLFAAAAGLAAWQLLEFIQQYRQRLGGHLAEAQLAYRQTVGAEVPGLNAATRQALALPQQERVAEIAQAWNALAAADPWLQPFTIARHIDFGIAGATFRAYQPALPLDLVSLSYAVAGMVFGWLLWELVKALLRPARRHRHGAVVVR